MVLKSEGWKGSSQEKTPWTEGLQKQSPALERADVQLHPSFCYTYLIRRQSQGKPNLCFLCACCEESYLSGRGESFCIWVHQLNWASNALINLLPCSLKLLFQNVSSSWNSLICQPPLWTREFRYSRHKLPTPNPPS